MNPGAARSGDVDLALEYSDGPPPWMLCVHATGFCKETWRPVVAALRDRGVTGGIVAMDQRGHGDSTVPPPPQDWWDLGRDVVAVADHLEGGLALGIGHSAGGAALVMAQLLQPGLFAALLLIEPIIFPPPFGRSETSPMAETARRRKARFSSREEALDNYRGRGPFARWEERALELYVDHGLRPDGDGITLKCPPEVEADFYRSASAHESWDRLGEITCPVVVVAGSDDVGPPALIAPEIAARLGNGRLAEVAGVTHFVPMERPERVAEIAAGLL